MVFVDSNIPMYLVGAAHPNKHRALALLRRVISEETRLVSDAEVIQEILHRYVAIQRRDAIQPAIDALYGVVDHVFPVEERDALRAKDLVLSYPRLSARDALHIAVMQSRSVCAVLTFDEDFEQVPGIARVR